MAEKKPREDLLCHKCGQNESSWLFYREKYSLDMGALSISEPGIMCDECQQIYWRDNSLTFHRFSEIANWSPGMIGSITSKKNVEGNELGNRFWRRKIWRIKAVYGGREHGTP